MRFKDFTSNIRGINDIIRQFKWFLVEPSDTDTIKNNFKSN